MSMSVVDNLSPLEDKRTRLPVEFNYFSKVMIQFAPNMQLSMARPYLLMAKIDTVIVIITKRIFTVL